MDDSKMPRIRRKEDLPDVMTMPLVAKTLGCSLTVAYRLLFLNEVCDVLAGGLAQPFPFFADSLVEGDGNLST